MKRIDPLVNGSYLNAESQKLALESASEQPLETQVQEVQSEIS